MAEPDDFVTAARIRDAGNVEESHIHGDATKDGAEATVDVGVTPIGKGAGQAVGVAGGDSGNTKIPRSTEGGAVADRLTFGNGSDEKNFGFPREDGLESRGGAPQRAVSVKT